jgi:hypothetical protein
MLDKIKIIELSLKDFIIMRYSVSCKREVSGIEGLLVGSKIRPESNGIFCLS